MKIYRELYVSEELKNKKDDVIEKLMENKIQWDIHLIVLPGDKNRQLEIINSIFLAYDIFSKEDLLIVGIAKGKSQALELTREIVSYIYSETGQVDICQFILSRQERKC